MAVSASIARRFWPTALARPSTSRVAMAGSGLPSATACAQTASAPGDGVLVGALHGAHVARPRVHPLLQVQPAHVDVRRRQRREMIVAGVVGLRLGGREAAHELEQFLPDHAPIDRDALDPDGAQAIGGVRRAMNAVERNPVDDHLPVDDADAPPWAPRRAPARASGPVVPRPRATIG